MLWSDNNFLYSIALCDTYNVAFTTHANNLAYLSVIAPVRHTLLNAWVNFYDYTVSRLVFVEQLAQSYFAPLSRAFSKETSCL